MITIGLTRGQVALIDKKDDVGIKWYCGNNGYAYNKNSEKAIALHRFVMERKLKRPLKPSEHVEHKNGMPLDCRRCNLRLCSPVLNMANSKIRTDNTTGVKGVTLDKRNGSYTAQYYIKGKKYHIGSFKTLKEASVARKAKEIKLYGDYVLRPRKTYLESSNIRQYKRKSEQGT